MQKKKLLILMLIIISTTLCSCTKTEYVTEYVYVEVTPTAVEATPVTPSTKKAEYTYQLPVLPPEIETIVIRDYPDFDDEYTWTADRTGNEPATEIPEKLIKPNGEMPFAPYDMEANGLRYGMSLEYVLEKMGTPDSAFEHWDEGVQKECLEIYYPNGDSYGFYDEGHIYILSSASIYSTALGPRGLCVGSSVEEVLSAFRIEEIEWENRFFNDDFILYSSKIIPENEPKYIMAPRGVIKVDYEYGNSFLKPDVLSINYRHPASLFVDGYYDDGDYPYYPYHFLSLIIDDGVLVYYAWGINVSAI